MRWFGLACAFTGGSFDGAYDLKKIADAEPSASLHLGLTWALGSKTLRFSNAHRKSYCLSPIRPAASCEAVNLGPE